MKDARNKQRSMTREKPSAGWIMTWMYVGVFALIFLTGFALVISSLDWGKILGPSQFAPAHEWRR